MPGKKAKYWAWGHPTKNNCTISQAVDALTKVWGHKDGLLFQNGKFDVDVADVHLGLSVPPWDKIHDTMFLLFLNDPHDIHRTFFSLKPSSEILLGMPPEEQDAVGDWLMANQPVPGVKISRSKNSEHFFGAYISYAPGDLVGKYANGDTERTEALFNLLWNKVVVENKMAEAYDRERRLMPVLLQMERQGLPVNLPRLRKDVKEYNEARSRVDAWLYKCLKEKPETLNLDSGDQLVPAMVAVKKCDTSLMPVTAGGKISTAKDSLLIGVTDKVLLAMLKYRTQLNTCLNTFMQPWLRIAELSGGLIYTNWNQVKAPRGDKSAGTRTGRLSSSPNFQNMAKEFKAIWKQEETDLKKAKSLPKCPIVLPKLPKVRSYIVPFKGEIFIDRDYSQQEPRILAHFDGGSMLDKYSENPWIDFHDYAKEELDAVGKVYARKQVKGVNLGLIYGMGNGLLAEKNEMTVVEATELKKAILQLYPGLKDMYKDMKRRMQANEPIRTWGGREYYCEPPKLVKGRIRHYDYKMVNVLIQGSAADCTKEACIRFNDVRKPEWRLVLQVHDQLTVSVPPKDVKVAMEVLRKVMEEIKFDVPMLSEGSTSKTNWDELIDYDKKGKLL